MWMKAKELDANTESYIELLAESTGKTKEEITKDVQRPKYFRAQEAIDYGLADKIIDSRDVAFEKQNYDEMLAQSKAMRRGAGVGPQAAPSGFRLLKSISIAKRKLQLLCSLFNISCHAELLIF
ncbi:hypothetical protein REPUB_Repub04eG0083300 [Reevesia pubescens]